MESIQTHIRLVGFRFVSPGWCIGTMGEKDIQDKQKRWQQNFDIDRTLTLTQEKGLEELLRMRKDDPNNRAIKRAIALKE